MVNSKFLFQHFSENRYWYFMHIVSNGDNLYEMPNPVFWKKIRKNINLSSPELA